jgi:hypothetical protein
MVKLINISLSTATISSLFGGWFYMESHFASASELRSIANTLEQSQIQLRLDILDDRIYREQQKENADVGRIGMMEAQIRRLEARQQTLMGAQ